ncbi:UvrABC system protein B [bioreactor metagenome]|uniref:UvrABC system protein B n=1 Tax=bioreactor metagenome TaxID=1076179 RepID=A0A645DX24_9ZZZZ
MAEELDKYLTGIGIRCRYIHSDVDTLERIEILEDFQAGRFDVLIGVNLLREGLDLPQVSLVAILDADKEGFLRSERALTQTAGRAARNVDGRVIMYADTITQSMKRTIDETERRRNKQMQYNLENNIIPVQIRKQVRNVLGKQKDYVEPLEETKSILADPVLAKLNPDQIRKAVEAAKKEMERAAAELDFMRAAKFRDEMNALKKLLG